MRLSTLTTGSSLLAILSGASALISTDKTTLNQHTRQTHTRHARPAQRAIMSPSPAPNSVLSVLGVTYTKFHAGSGFIETDQNPSNTYGDTVVEEYPPRQTTFASAVSQNAAIQACAEFANDPDYYYAFQIYFLQSQDQWVCRTYYHLGIGGPADSDSSYFNVRNDDAIAVYGYQVQS